MARQYSLLFLDTVCGRIKEQLKTRLFVCVAAHLTPFCYIGVSHMSREYMAPSHEMERLILGVPEALQAYRHFVGWEERPRQNKTTKVPLNPRTGYYADVTDPSTWGSFKQAIDM